MESDNSEKIDSSVAERNRIVEKLKDRYERERIEKIQNLKSKTKQQKHGTKK